MPELKPSKSSDVAGQVASQPNLIAAFQTAVRAGLGAGIAVAIAQFLNLPYPIYAMITAVIVTDLSPAGTRKLGLPRIAGTVLGAFIGAVLSLLLPPTAWSIGLGIFAALFLSEFLGLRPASKLTAYTCGIVMLSYGDHPWIYALYRLTETSLGIGVAMAVSFIPKFLKSDAA